MHLTPKTSNVYVLGLLALLVVQAPALISCEVSDSGQLAVTWRFNGHAGETGANPCAGIGANRIVIELDGPTQFSEVVSCNNVDPDYPLLWLGFAASLPVNAYGRLMRSVPRGSYTVRVFFIDDLGNQTADPLPLVEKVRVRREKIVRIDLDFQVITGSIAARWRIGGAAPSQELCEAVGATSVLLQAQREGEVSPASEVVAPCPVVAGVGLVGLEPGEYSLSGQLLDAQGGPITGMVTQTNRSVTAADTVGGLVNFPWEVFSPPVSGNLRVELAYGDAGTMCSEVEGLAAGPLFARFGMTDSQGAPVTGVVAYANPTGQTDCDGLTVAQQVDGVSLEPCTDDELILCDLLAGGYQVTLAALDASDLVCYGATVDVEVTPLAPQEPSLVVLATSDASACWE